MTRLALTFVIAAAVASTAPAAPAAPAMQVRPEWSSFFADADAHGTVVVVDARSGGDVPHVSDPERARRR